MAGLVGGVDMARAQSSWDFVRGNVVLPGLDPVGPVVVVEADPTIALGRSAALSCTSDLLG